MLNTKRGTLIISFIVAVALWMYVVGEMDPVTTRSISGVPVQYTNEQALEDNGMAVKSDGPDKLTVRIRGKRSVVSRVSAADLNASVDLSQAGVGENSLKISVELPSNVELSSQSVNRAKIQVEKLVKKMKTVRISYLGDFSDGEEPTTLDVDPEQVSVSGASSEVNSVSYVKASVNRGTMTSSRSVAEAKLTPVDESGREVKNVKLSDDTARVTSALYQTKTVPLKVPVTDHSTDGLKRTWEAPATVTIKGPSEILKNVSKIRSETIDVSAVKESSDLTIQPKLPDGVKLAADSGALKLSVKVAESDPSKEKSFTFRPSDITVNGTPDGTEATILTESVTVTVTGTSDELKNISKKDITLSIALGDLDLGNHYVPITVKCGEESSSITTDPEEISVKISQDSAR